MLRTGPGKGELFVLLCILPAVIANQTFYFLSSVQRQQSKINALLTVHCCTKTTIDPSAVTMAMI